MRRCWQLCILILFVSAQIRASIFGSITGLIHDPQHRPVQGAKVTIWANSSKWSQSTISDASGEFRFDNVALGAYTVQIETVGFAPQTQLVTLSSDAELRLHFALIIAESKESVQVTDTTSGFRAVNRKGIALFAADYPHDYPEVEATVMLVKHKLRLTEVPVAMRERGGGASSITAFRSIYYMTKVLLAIFVGLFRRYAVPLEEEH